METPTKKPDIWSHHGTTMIYDAFRKLKKLLQMYDISSIPDEVSLAIKEHLVGLKTNLQEHFLPKNNNKTWIWNPFTVNVESETALLDSEIEHS